MDSMSPPVAEVQADDDLREIVTSRRREAIDRLNFHRIEAERWERVARACEAALNEIDVHTPIATVTPDEPVIRQATKPMPSPVQG